LNKPMVNSNQVCLRIWMWSFCFNQDLQIEALG
jgi:hypothetical protein